MSFFFDHYPYTNFHNINLDWVLEAVKAWGRTVDHLGQEFIDLKAVWEQFKFDTNAMLEEEMQQLEDDYTMYKNQLGLQYDNFTTYVENYLNNLDYETEIAEYMQGLVNSGELRVIIAPTVANATSEWLTQHVTPTTPAIDNTLTVSGAGADARVTGNFIRELIKNTTGLLDESYNSFRLVGFNYGHTNTTTGVIDNTYKWLTKDYIYHNKNMIYLYVAPTFKAEILYYNNQGTITGHISNIYSTRVIPENSYFKLSIGYRDAREMTETEIEVCMKNIFILSNSQQELFNFINNEHSITKSLLYGGTFNPPLEIGGVNADTDVLLTQYDRFRTVKGYKYRVYKGDTITLSDFTTYKLYVRMFLLDGSYTTSNWVTETYTIPYDCYCYVLVQRIDGETLTTDDLKLSNSLVTFTTIGIYGDTGKDIVRLGAFSSTTGEYAYSATRMCNTNYLKYPYPVRIKVASGYRAYVSTYKEDSNHTFIGYYQVENNEMAISANTVFRWYARTENSDNITNDEIANYTNIINIISDEYNGLTQYGDNFTLSLFETVGILGDSYASGAMHHIEDSEIVTVNYNVSWGQILARKHGFIVTNYTKGGLSTKTWLTDTTYGLPAMLADTAKNLYIINFGINDRTQINNGTFTMGTIEDCTNDYDNNPVTFYGCYGRIIGNIQNHAPNAKIIILSVARYTERADMDSHIQEIAEHFNIPFIYLPDDDYFVSKYYYDSIFGRHPLSYGYAGMAQAIDRLINRYFNLHPEYLRNYYGLT